MYGYASYGSTPYGVAGAQAGTAPISTVTGVTVTPSTVAVSGGGTVDFDWVIAGTNSPSQSATVTTTLGTVNSAGVLTAPAATSSAQTGTVTVTSAQDPTKSGTATFTIAATQAGDTTAPTLTAASATATGQTTATGTVTTNETGGTLYWLANTSATATAAQVKAGSSKAVTAAGAQSVSLTGLAAGTLYYLHFLHADGAVTPNESTVANTASFTTQSAGDTTGPVMQGAISFTKTSTTNDLSWPAATDASGIGEYFVSRDGGAPVSTGLTRSKSFGGLSPSTQHQYVVTANDIYGNPSSNSLTVTVQTDESSAAYATYIEETFVDVANAPRGSLSGMRWYVWSQVGAEPIGAPIAQGVMETTDAAGVSRMDISGQTVVMPGDEVRLGYTNDNGNPAQEGLFSWFGTVLAH